MFKAMKDTLSLFSRPCSSCLIGSPLTDENTGHKPLVSCEFSTSAVVTRA